MKIVRTLLLFLARQDGFKKFALNFPFFRKTASRFVAGETLEDALQAVRLANQQRLLGILDLLGENTVTLEDAGQAGREVSAVLDLLQAENVNCNISVKLTQLGLALDAEAAFQNLLRITKHAREKDNFVWVDMEESRYTQSTLDIVARAHREQGNVGAVIQAYLYRSERDIIDLMKKGIPVRLVKGAYLEPGNVAFHKKRQTDANFLKLMPLLLAGKTMNAIATHDESIIDATKEYARSQGISKDRFEFQLLYGIRRDLQLRLAEEGYRVRIYIPYGRQWYAYFMRRLAERPANVSFIVRNFFKG
jgi:proline dehydrogenase